MDPVGIEPTSSANQNQFELRAYRFRVPANCRDDLSEILHHSQSRLRSPSVSIFERRGQLPPFSEFLFPGNRGPGGLRCQTSTTNGLAGALEIDVTYITFVVWFLPIRFTRG